MKMKKAFTLIELMVAIAVLVIVLSFAGVIFKVSIGAYRTAMANAEIMQKLRAVTDQLNRDFEGLQKDGYLMLFSEVKTNRREYRDSDPCDFRADRLYYFSTGDFQSWFEPDIRSNIARVYFGHDYDSLFDIDKPVCKWNLARDVMLLTPGYSFVDCNDTSYAECKVDLWSFENPFDKLGNPIRIDTLSNPPTNPQSLMCQNAGEIKIEWTDGTKYPAPNNSLAWFGLDMPRSVDHPGIPADPAYKYIELTDLETFYIAFWIPVTSRDELPMAPGEYWPKALKITFTLYDSKGTLKGGRTFTHIVYLGD